MNIGKKILNSRVLLITFFSLMLLIRLVYLDADPSFVKRVGDLSDEGVWVHNPRTLFVFGNLTPDEVTQSLSVTPLNALLMMGSFSLFGVGTFQARLVSALAGWFTLLILYFFLKKAWNRKAAFIGVLILGVNETFLIYNKLALGISLEAMFILLSFFWWYQGKENNSFYFLSGLSFAFAILSKLSAYYLAPIFLLLWLLQMYRKEMSFHVIIIFGVGVALPLLPYLIYLNANWEILSTNFLVLAKNYNSGGVVILNIFRSFSNNLFGLPGMFLLIFLTTLYFLKEPRFKNFKSMDLTELMALCWLLGGFLLVVLLSDLSDRRFYGLLIPLSILSTKLFFEESSFDLKALIQRIAERLPSRFSWNNIRYALLFSFPLVSFLVSSLSLYFCRPINICESKQGYMVVLFFLVFIVFLIILTLSKGKIKKYSIHFFTLFSVAALLLIPLSTLLRHFSRHYAIITSAMDKEVFYIFESLIFVVVLIVAYIVLSFRFTSLLWFDRALIKKFFLLYFVISGTLISITLIAPSFSARDGSRSLDPLLGKAEAMGSSVSVLSFDASYLPIFGPLFDVNRYYDLSRVKYIFSIEVWEGKPVKDGSGLLEQYRKSHLIKRIYLYPYPFTHTYREVIAVYEVGGYKGLSPLSEMAQPLLGLYDYTGKKQVFSH